MKLSEACIGLENGEYLNIHLEEEEAERLAGEFIDLAVTNPLGEFSDFLGEYEGFYAEHEWNDEAKDFSLSTYVPRRILFRWQDVQTVTITDRRKGQDEGEG